MRAGAGAGTGAGGSKVRDRRGEGCREIGRESVRERRGWRERRRRGERKRVCMGKLGGWRERWGGGGREGDGSERERVCVEEMGVEGEKAMGQRGIHT